MSNNQESTLDGVEAKAISRSEQRKKNRAKNKLTKKSDSNGEPTEGLFTRIYNFFVEAKEELLKVIWPTKKETIDTTWRLLILVVISGLYLSLVDSILTWLINLVI